MSNTYLKTDRVSPKATLVYILIALLIMWPLLGSGYIFALDMAFTPKLAMPETTTSSYIFRTALHFFSIFIAGDVLQKLMLFSILLFSGLGMHRHMRLLGLPHVSKSVAEWAAYASGLLYMINPFTYSRFMAGQYSVLLGYALLPFFVTALLRFLEKPSYRQSLILAAWAVSISIVSIHTLGLAAIVVFVALLYAVWSNRHLLQRLKQYVRFGLVAVTVFFVASSYWLIPLLRGDGSTATSIATFRTSDQSAFVTEGDGIAGKLAHVMRLQGFWGEEQGLYLLPQDELPAWGLVVILVWTLVIVGAVTAWRLKRESGALFIACIVIAALLAAGVGTSWLADHVPFFAGYREPQKFVALIAFGYAVFVGFAILRLLAITHKKIYKMSTALALILILVGFTPVMFRGFDGQLVPRQYPTDWYATNEILSEDEGNFQVLALPWHLYMRYQFAGRVIINPADSFFDKPLLVSDDPEFGSVGPAVPNAQKRLLTTDILPNAPRSNAIGHRLAPLNIKYVLLSKDSDYELYSYLDHQKDLQLVSESATLKLYKNTAYSKGNVW